MASADLTVKELYLEVCEEGELEVLRYLLKQHANVNWRQDGGLLRSGLHHAVMKDYGQLMDLLLSAPGVDVNIPAMSNITPLMMACSLGKDHLVRKLLQKGADLNLKDCNGDTGLHSAVDHNDLRCVEALGESAELDWNIKSGGGDSAVSMAVSGGCADVLQYILSLPHHLVDLTVLVSEGDSLAWLAVKALKGDPMRCVQLLSKEDRVDWNTRDEDGDTPLMYCLKARKIEMAKIILKNPQVDLHISNNDGKFPETIARLVCNYKVC